MDALVIIDVQQGMFTFPGYTPHDGEATVARIGGLLSRARNSGTPVFFVQHDGGEGDPLAAGSPGFPFLSELAPAQGESVTVKRHSNAFQETDLDQKLKRSGIDRLIVCGMQTEFCIDTAVRAAFEREYKVVLVSDGHTTFDTKTLPGAQIIAHHNAVLGGGFAKAMPADEVEFARPIQDKLEKNENYAISFGEIDDPQTRQALSTGLRAFNENMLGAANVRPLTLSLRSEVDGATIGGLIGRTVFNWLYVELLFVPESLRGRGLGGKLLAMAEEEARKRGAVGAWLDTLNPSARKFYEKRGFRVCGEVPDIRPGHGQYFLLKKFGEA